MTKNNQLLLGSSRASFTLQAIFSTMGGIAFIMMLVNLTRYVTAVNAVEQAARKTARCITPTDPACTSYSSTGANTDLDWYAQIKTPPQPSTFMLDRYAYSAQMIAQTWTANYTTYETHMVKPRVSWTDQTVTLKTFVPALNTFEARYASIQRQTLPSSNPATFFPRYSPNFPRFDQGYEDGGGTPLIDQDESNWHPLPRFVTEYAQDGSILSRRARFEFRPLSMHAGRASGSASSDIDSGSAVTFYSDITSVGPAYVGNCESGHSCDVGDLVSRIDALGGSDKHDSFRFAHLAVKSFSTVRASGAQVKWGTDSGADGLQIVWGRTAPKSGKPWAHSRDLGGRTWESINGEENYHLVLRGPEGANGAGSLSKAISIGKVHDDIVIPRGNVFRIIARFSAKSGHIDRVTPHIYFYFDEYYQTEGTGESLQTVDCGEVRLTPGDTPKCPESCAIAGVLNANTTCTVVNGSERSEPSCADDGKMFPASSDTCTSSTTYRAAVCTDSETPSLEATASAQDALTCDRLVCGWAENASARNSISVAPSSCASPRTAVHTETCSQENIFKPDGNYGDISSCSVVANKSAASSNEIADVLAAYPDTTATIKPISSANFQWSGEELFTPDRWVGTWLPPTDVGVGSAPDSVLKRNTQITSLTPWYARIDNASPQAKNFDYKAPLNSSTSAPPEEFYDTVRLSLTSEERKVINHTYPFAIASADGGSYELPYWGPDTQSPTADYDLDCDYEDKCAAIHPEFSTEESMLRSYASGEIPEAIDPNLVFQYAKSPYLRTDFFESEAALSSALASQGVSSACVPKKSRCSAPEITGTIYLGRFPSSDSPDGPASCQAGGSYAHCYSQAPSGAVFAESVTTGSVNMALAQSVGQSEISRLLSVANLQDDCNDQPGCAEVKVTADDGEKRADVQVAYNLPLSFPLAQILGKNSLRIQHDKKEMREFELAGR